jgi:predicted RNA binding protein YcfA (HicA-like mRNA interferase family)
MTRLPRLKGKEVVRVLERFGFEVVRTRGSHVFQSILTEE